MQGIAYTEEELRSQTRDSETTRGQHQQAASTTLDHGVREPVVLSTLRVKVMEGGWNHEGDGAPGREGEIQ